VFARDLQPICAVFEMETWLALSDGARHLRSFIRISHSRVRYNEKPSQETFMDLTSCILCKYLVFHTFVARRFQVRLDARAPSVESWSYLLRRLSCNVEDITPSTPFRDLILATNLWKEATDTISLHVFKACVTIYHIKRVMMFAHQITCAAFHFVIWIAPTEIRV